MEFPRPRYGESRANVRTLAKRIAWLAMESPCLNYKLEEVIQMGKTGQDLGCYPPPIMNACPSGTAADVVTTRSQINFLFSTG